VYETAPPSQGFLVLEQLNILEGYDLRSLPPFSAERMHLLVEAKKLAFADRNRVAGDPAFVQWPLEQFISKGPCGGSPRGDRPEARASARRRAGRRA
jgi:gamma-glutamyltranspeptidase/glutathione hydrolase